MLLCACSHTERKADFADLKLKIPESTIHIESTNIFESMEIGASSLSLPALQYENEIPPFLFSCGMYIQESSELVNMSLEDLEKNYGALIATSSYKKWTPIEGEVQTVIVFNFQN
jgi:hypothetical protein